MSESDSVSTLQASGDMTNKIDHAIINEAVNSAHFHKGNFP